MSEEDGAIDALSCIMHASIFLYMHARKKAAKDIDLNRDISIDVYTRLSSYRLMYTYIYSRKNNL